KVTIYRYCSISVTLRTELYTLSLHDALPIFLLELGEQLAAEFLEHRLAALARQRRVDADQVRGLGPALEALDRLRQRRGVGARLDRKSTRLNSSHVAISYAVFCLKKKNQPTP